MSERADGKDGTDLVRLVAPEISVIADLMLRHSDCDATITIADVLGRRVLVIGFNEGDDQRDPTTHTYLVTYRYDMEAKRFVGEATQL